MSPDLATAARAYRAERERYWVRRRVVGESRTAAGSTSVFTTEVHLATGEVVFCGAEPDAKSWLDVACLAAALSKLFLEPGDGLRAAAATDDPLAGIAAVLSHEP